MNQYLAIFPMMLIVVALAGCAPDDGRKSIADVQQASALYVESASEAVLIDAKRQKALAQQYLKHFYSPWSPPAKDVTALQVKDMLTQRLARFIDKPGFGENTHQFDQHWLAKMRSKLALDTLNGQYQTAITVEMTNVRMLPTNEPSYASFEQAGQGYPFDRIQDSLLPSNTPILVLHQSADKEWNFVRSHMVTGWIKSNVIAFAGKKFIEQWHTGHYVTPKVKSFPVMDKRGRFYFTARLGTIYPIASVDSKDTVFIAVSTASHHAHIKVMPIPSAAISIWPIPATTKNMTTVADALLGEPYGWGGMYGYRDCSATMMDILAPFGIWLPRDTKDQAKAGHFVSFDNLTVPQKEKLIHQEGKGLLTLIDLSGHVQLYLGARGNNMYVLHNIWGMKTGGLIRKKGRSVIGETVITPITLGQQYWNVRSSFLDKAYGMTIVSES